MNRIRESMEGIHASDELKKNTLDYLKTQKNRPSKNRTWRYVLAAACLLIFLTAGGGMAYIRPVAYISVDVNPSIELAVNRFGRVVAVEGYNEDAEFILEQVRLKNMSYIKAIGKLLEDASYSAFLTDDSRLFLTVISDNAETFIDRLSVNGILKEYGAEIYTSDTDCRKEAHQHHMSFGKYRAYQELSEYDESVTVEECHDMTMGELSDRIDTCKGGDEAHHGQEQGGEEEEAPQEQEEEQFREQNYEKHHGHGH